MFQSTGLLCLAAPGVAESLNLTAHIVDGFHVVKPLLVLERVRRRRHRRRGRLDVVGDAHVGVGTIEDMQKPTCVEIATIRNRCVQR